MRPCWSPAPRRSSLSPSPVSAAVGRLECVVARPETCGSIHLDPRAGGDRRKPERTHHSCHRDPRDPRSDPTRPAHPRSSRHTARPAAGPKRDRSGPAPLRATYWCVAFAEVTVTDIAERAGLTKCSFFNRFVDRREVLFADAEAFEPTLTDAHFADLMNQVLYDLRTAIERTNPTQPRPRPSLRARKACQSLHAPSRHRYRHWLGPDRRATSEC